MVWNRSKYKLPRFPATVAQTFKLLCEEIDEQEVGSLSVAVDARHQRVIERSVDNSLIDVEGSRKLVQVCHYLLSLYSSVPSKSKKLIIGAVRYYAISEDPFDDEVFASGLYDDMRIVNHVLEKLGIHDRYLST